jgi:hypothetical protein
LSETNTLANKKHRQITDVKSFVTLGPGANVIKLILSAIYGFLYQARVFVILDWKSLPMTNTLTHNKHWQITNVKSFVTLAPGHNVTKLFTSVIC